MRARRPAYALCLALLLPGTAMAQEDDRGYLTAFLEDNLSSAGQKVTITGFEGALSSRASMQRLQIADDTGVWITLDDVVLDWSRSSLLSGEVVVNELSAATITLDRLPVMATDTSLPAPEAGTFALPELPVSVDIGKVEAARIVLGEAVLGEPVEGRFQAALSLMGGEGKAALVLERTDGPVSRITLDAAYSNASSVLALNLSAKEEAGGIAARMLDLPGQPSVDLAIQGQGALSDFAAEVRLASDGVERLSGPVTITEDTDGAYRFVADLAGDLAPLFLPDYAAFLGEKVSLSVAGARWPSGQMKLDRLELQARALAMSGSASVAADGLPEAFDLSIRIGTEDGLPVLLPLPGPNQTRLGRADLALTFDAAKGNDWSGKALLTGLERDGMALGYADLTGSGRIERLADGNSLDATLAFQVDGLALADAALQQAIGATLTGKTVLFWHAGTDALRISQLSVKAEDFSADSNLQIEGLQSGFQTKGRVTLKAADLSRFSALTGLPLAGSADLLVEGEANRLTGAFDLSLNMVAEGLRTGIAQADRLLAGTARLTASARRDETGTTLRALDLTAKSLVASGKGKLSSLGNELTGQLSFADLGDLDPGWGGGLTANASFVGTSADGTLMLSGQGRRLSIGQPEVDRLIAGETALDVVLKAKGGKFILAEATLDGPNLTAEARGSAGSDDLQVTGRIRDLALLAPGYPGPVTLSGRLTPTVAGTSMDLRVLGPAAIDAQVAGSITGTTADLTLRGTADAALLNALADPATLAGTLSVDLALRGALSPASLSGRVTLSGGRIAYPYRGLSLTRTEVVADLTGGRARLSATAELTAGGRLRLDGTVGLAAPFDGSLDLQLDTIRLRDPELYDTTISGLLRISGPLLGRALMSGRVAVGETQLLIPSTGFGSASDLEAITHIRDSAEVRATRRRAGLNGNGGNGVGNDAGRIGLDWALNVAINAPNRIFLRGRGLDAELGGSVILGGTLRAISPSGGIQLIRGRLDLLGKRLDLSRANLALEGDLVPFISVSASNETDSVTTTVTIEGPANAPEVTFSSSPEMPQEEVLAWLLFGRGLDTISVLQAAELANAVAVLAGRGGEGIVAKLRRGFGFDDLDVSTADDGTASVAAGKYLTKKIYTGVEVDQTGKSRIDLNLDLRKGVTVKGRVGSDGQSGIGIYLERDY